VGISGSASIGFAFMAALKESQIGICSEPVNGIGSFNNFGKNKYGRVYAGKRMAYELLLPNAFAGISVTGGLLNIGPAALAVLYGLGNPCNCQTTNQPPDVPSNPNPANNAINVSTSTNLTWVCSDTENDSLSYDINFGTNSNPSLIATTWGNSSFEFQSPLQSNTKYYWKVIAYDDKGNVTIGNEWSFTTTGNSGGQPCPGTPTILYEGKTYNTVQIGNQCWLKENLNVGTRINGSQNQNATNGIK
jgi:hypothetical protein